MDNNREFWNQYAKDFKNNPQNSKYEFNGNQWRGEEIFLNLLSKYLKQSNNCLEIGCGGCRITNHAAPLVNHIIATDISEEMIDSGKDKLLKYNNIDFEVTDGFRLDQFPSNSQDRIYSHDVFVHFSSMQVYPYLVQMHRILKPGGIGMVSFYNFVTHFKIFKGWAIKFNTQKMLPQSMRHHFMTEEMLRVMLEDIGYEVVEIEKTNFLIGVFKKT